MNGAGGTPPELTVERLPELPGGAEVWGELARNAGVPFSTWEWASAWWRHFGEGREQRVLGFRDAGGELVAALPLYVAQRRPLRVLRVAGHGPADQLGPACAPELAPAVARALKRALAEWRDWEVCLLERLPSRVGWNAALGGVVTRLESCPTIEIETRDWDAFLATKSPRFRSQTRRLERKLRKTYEAEIRVADDPERIEDDMGTFLALHESRWSGIGTTAFQGALSQFHREIAGLALAGGWLRLYMLELDGQPRAALYCFRLGDADWYYQAGRDPDFDRDRVGNVILANAVRDAVEAGRNEFKLLLGEHSYKNRLMTADAPVESVALTRNALLAGALRATVRAKSRAAALRGS